MSTKPEIVWNEIGPSEHFVQFYENDSVLLDTIDGFIGSGLIAGDAGIVIGTPDHLEGLHDRFVLRGIDVPAAIQQHQYLPLDAAATLAKFIDRGWPDRARFTAVIREIIGRVSQGNRRVRAFGEMVSLLWAEGNEAATIRLERLWNDLGKTDAFSLFCAYPKHGFNAELCCGSLSKICAEHSRVITASGKFEFPQHEQAG